ncbi:MAG: membrane dipeptidase [Christensenellaceae bacterium]|jgi:microsomal dipeptidase-like Zn-dependent dipeptidase|nr:membrane dipeptidase [Christensenellaceae bacterium]
MQIFDLHNDALLELPEDELLKYLQQIQTDGVKQICLSVWTTEIGKCKIADAKLADCEITDPMTVIKTKRRFLDSIKVCAGINELANVENRANIKEFGNVENRTAIPQCMPQCFLHIEDAHFLTPQNIDEFISLKPVTVGLSWNDENALVGGANSNAGITRWGYEAIKKLEDAGIQIDTAHLNRQSFWQFAAITTKPILCTHTCFDAVHPHQRNLTDEQIMAVIKSGGLIGLTFVRQFLCSDTISCSSYDITNHILHYLTIDPNGEHLAIGTDYYGTNPVKGIETYADFSNLINALKQRGVRNEIIQKILYKNAHRFFNVWH